MAKRVPLFYPIIALFLLTLSLTGCGKETDDAAPSAGNGPLAAFAGLSGELDIAGGTAHIPVMNEAAERIMKTNPAVRITVAGGGSGVGVQKVGKGLVQIGNAGRPLSEEEMAEYGLKSFPFAVDGVCAVVHPDNPITAFTSQQLKDIFAGAITNWQELGGADHAIHLFTRDEASGTRKVFWKKGLGKGEIHSGANVVASNGAMKTALAGDLYAIGYVSIGHLDASLKAPSLDGVAVTQQNASDGTYPVTRKLYMNTKGEPEGLTRAFIDYILGPEGAKIVQDKGYLPMEGK
jgi:phosphate transport system substrate-binding protein